MSQLEDEFERAMLTICDEREIACNCYNPTYLRWAIKQYGGVGAAYHILSLGPADEASSGLKKLKKCGKLDLSVQALMLKPKFASLFNHQALQEAHETLCKQDYQAPWDTRPC